MVKIVKNPGNGRLNNLNDPVLNGLSVTFLKETTVNAELYDVPTQHGVLHYFFACCICLSSSFNFQSNYKHILMSVR